MDIRPRKITTSLLNKIDTYSKDALNWLIEDGIASEINTIVERDSKYRTDQYRNSNYQTR